MSVSVCKPGNVYFASDDQRSSGEEGEEEEEEEEEDELSALKPKSDKLSENGLSSSDSQSTSSSELVIVRNEFPRKVRPSIDDVQKSKSRQNAMKSRRHKKKSQSFQESDPVVLARPVKSPSSSNLCTGSGSHHNNNNHHDNHSNNSRRRSKRHHRHTLFGGADATGDNVTSLNYDIEAVKLEHSRKVWPNSTNGSVMKTVTLDDDLSNPDASCAMGVGRRPSISSEQSLSDCEELGITHPTGLEQRGGMTYRWVTLIILIHQAPANRWSLVLHSVSVRS